MFTIAANVYRKRLRYRAANRRQGQEVELDEQIADAAEGDLVVANGGFEGMLAPWRILLGGAGPCYDRPVDDDDLFRRAVAGALPLAERPGKVVRSRRAKKPPPPRRAGGGFEIEQMGEHVEGLAKGGDRRQLRELRRGEVPVELRLDLHGLSQEAAHRAVEAAVELAYGTGQRCLLVIHGRGHHSESGPVLKEALPSWLTGPRCAARVVAFTTAPPEQGGVGATLVLLRRRS